MKRTTLLSFFLILGICSIFAQPTENHWDIINYKGSAAVVIINQDSARIQKNTDVFTFKIKTENQFVHLADKKTEEKILSLLNISKNEIDKKYPQNKNLLPTEKLLTVAHSFPDQKLLIGATQTIALNGDNDSASGTDTLLQDQNFSENITAKNDNKTNLLYFILFDIIALAIGFWIGISLKRKREKKQGKTTIAALDPVKLQMDIQKLQSENTFLQQRMSQTLAQLDDSKTFDTTYFEHAFEQIILPLQESLEKGNKAKTLELLTIAAAQLSSISRNKIGKKLKHDDANILYLSSGNIHVTSPFPTISADTAIDKIPHNIKMLIQLLKENHVSDLNHTIVLGYKIEDL